MIARVHAQDAITAGRSRTVEGAMTNHGLERIVVAEPNLPPSDLDARMRALERITQIFRLERMVYLGFAIAAFVMLIVCVVAAVVRQEQSLAGTLGAFGSSGVVTITSGRVLVMWNRAMSIITPNGDSDA
jgi:hypothetical protein